MALSIQKVQEDSRGIPLLSSWLKWSKVCVDILLGEKDIIAGSSWVMCLGIAIGFADAGAFAMDPPASSIFI